jgi:hypothetical protein
MTTFNFTDRASYLTWRAEWKANYKKLSQDIRELKVQRSTINREWAKAGGFIPSKFYETLRQLAFAIRQANEQLEELKEAKIAAAASYTANKEIAMQA